ncbi:MAG: ATP-binding protein [Microbacteriaceae bacterium]
MDRWIAEHATLLVIVLAAATGILLVLAVSLLIAWLRARSARKRQVFDRVSAERDRINLELSLAEQTGRLRIIREMHEVAVLSVAGIISTAEGARYAAAADPAVAARSAGQIADLARTTLGDLRRVMTVVREGEADAAPQPRLKSARDLFKVMRDAGLIVTFEEIGERYRLAPGAELAVYRILQEALSNSLKYGGEGTEARVVFTWTADGLQLKVDDDGARAALKRRGVDPNDTTHQHRYSIEDDLNALTGMVEGVGITEMRERAALFGGVFTAVPVPGVGFSVSVVFPHLKYHNGVHDVNLARL